MAVPDLKEAIKNQDTLTASLLVAGHFSPGVSASEYKNRVDALTKAVKQDMLLHNTDEAGFKALVKRFYTKLAFTGSAQDFFSSKYSLLNEVIDYRTGIPVTLSILFCHIASTLGFNVSGVNFPGHFLIRYEISDERVLFVDPLDGRFLNWQELESLYFSILGDMEEDEMPAEVLEAAEPQDIVLRLLQNLKAAFIKEEKYQAALSTIELLIQFCPDDPYERRDRGYLLHQLECPQVAMADYQYFIRQCPQDPAAQLLKLQIRHLSSEPPMILH